MMQAWENPLHLEGYTLGEEIGRGTLGTVYSAKSTETGRTFAAKKLLIEDTSIREIGVLTHLRKHPNIVEYVESKLGRDGETQVLFVISEFCPLGDIGDYILKQQVDVVTKRNLAVQLADAITFLHKNEIVHRDIKPQNVLLTGNEAHLVLKVVDFGLARMLPNPGNGANNSNGAYMRSAVGTRFYLSPEIYQSLLNNQPCRYTSSVDIFSMGLLFWAMFEGLSIPGSCGEDRYLTPFVGSETDPMPVAQAVTQGDIELKVMEREENLRCKKLLRDMLSRDPKDRPSAQNVLSTLIRGFGNYRVRQWASPVDDARNFDCSSCLCLNRNPTCALCERERTDASSSCSPCTCREILCCISCMLCYLDKNQNFCKFWSGKGLLFVLFGILISLIILVAHIVGIPIMIWMVLMLGFGIIFYPCAWCIKEHREEYCMFITMHCSVPGLRWWRISPANVYNECPCGLCLCLSPQSGCCHYNHEDMPECCSSLVEVIVVPNQVEHQTS